MDSKQTRERRKKKTVSKQPPPPLSQQQQQQQQQPMKVVYISNPMKLNTSASNFRSLVQELTGQHSVWPVDPSKYSSEYNNSISIDAAADVSGSNSNNTDSGMEMEMGKYNNGGAAEPCYGSSDPYSQPLDQDACDRDDDRVVLIDHHTLHYMLDDHHQYFAGFVNSGYAPKN